MLSVLLTDCLLNTRRTRAVSGSRLNRQQYKALNAFQTFISFMQVCMHLPAFKCYRIKNLRPIEFDSSEIGATPNHHDLCEPWRTLWQRTCSVRWRLLLLPIVFDLNFFEIFQKNFRLVFSVCVCPPNNIVDMNQCIPNQAQTPITIYADPGEPCGNGGAVCSGGSYCLQ